ncbi:MAG: hypothetical protein AB9846_10195 [Tenuifilaceae bacterium]
MNAKKFYQLAVICIAVVLFVSCKKEANLWQPKPPYPGLEVKIASFTINTAKDTILVLSNGTAISIPAGIMVDAEGVAITGLYELLYREFHDAIDIMLSGIPMDFNSMGEKRTLQTAGMFEIDAIQNNKKLRISDGKSIDVRFASKYPGSNYNFFFMNPAKGEWEWVDLPETEINQEKVDAVQALNTKAPKSMLGDKFFVLSFDRFLDIYLNDDYNRIYKLRKDKTIKKKLEAYKFKTYDVSIVGEVIFLKSYYHPAEMLWREVDGKTFPKWINDFVVDWKKDSNGKWYIANYSFLNLGNNIYQVNYTGTNKTFSKKMEAVMPLSSILKLSADQWQQRYDEAMEKLKAEQKKIDLMAETYRSFSVNRLGTYNFDCLLKGLDEWTKINASFMLSDKPAGEGNVMIILGDNSGYINVPKTELNNMRINPLSGHRIMMILPNQELGIFPIDKMKSINIDSLKALPSPSYTFNLETRKINDAVELREILGF